MENVKKFLQELFVYNELVNDKFIDALKQAGGKIPKRCVSLMSHILLVQQSWNNRMEGKEGLVDFWTEIMIDDLQIVNNSLNKESVALLSSVDLQGTFLYKNSKGTEFNSKYIDVLFHLINHGTQYRGQINVLLRESGIEPVVNDYIFYKR